MLLLTTLIPIGFIFYTYRFLDSKNKEPKRAIIFAFLFSLLVFFIEFFLVKPSFGKFLSFYDTFYFAYFISEEPEHLQSLSIWQNCLIIILSSLSKSITYAVGIKVLFTNLYRLGKTKFFAGKHLSVYGFLDEPIDYAVYSLVFFSGISLMDNFIHLRLNSALSIEKLQAFFILFSYLCIAILICLIWLRFKISNSKDFHPTSFLNFGGLVKLNSNKLFLLGLISKIELSSFITIFVILFMIKIIFLISNIAVLLLLMIIPFFLLIFLFRKIKKLGNANYSIVSKTTQENSK